MSEKALATIQTVTAGYVDLANSEMRLPLNGTFSYVIQATVQDIKFKIKCSNDGDNWADDTPETDLVAGESAYEAGPAFALYYKVQIIKGAVAGGKVTAQGYAK